ncbi:MAG: GC-type dockerin domain-anchored protein [Phycisphaerales bacterium JB054]
MKNVRHMFVIAAVLACAGAPAAMAEGKTGPAAQDRLSAQYPGVRFFEDQGRTRIVYGNNMTTAATPREAAEGWLNDHVLAFGAGPLDLDETAAFDVKFGEFFVFHYTQTMQGLPVDSSVGRVLAHNNHDGTWSVVYAAGLFAPAPEGGFAPMTRTAQDATNFIRGTEYGRLPKWSAPELVVYQRQTEAGFEAVRAWQFVGENPDLLRREKYTFFVDASTGALLEARNEVHHIDVFGRVQGFGSPGNEPDRPQNPPALLNVNDIRVAISGGNNAYTDDDGVFNISHGGNSNVTISATFDVGEWCNINNQGSGGVLSESGTATPGVEANLTFNQTPSEYETAQVNAFIHTGKIHNLITDRSGWGGMNFVCTTNVNINSSCNAFFDGSSINFYRKAGSCNNTAYSTIVAHEYGHYIVARLGLGQGAFGEGYGDTCGEMLYDTGIVGEYFFLNGHLRDNDNTVRTYPCQGAIHDCGQVLGGLWWHAREHFGTTYGSEAGLEEIQQLFVDWSMITTGGSGSNSAHPGTAIEMLTVDDDDGNIFNGTPNYDDLALAFDQHTIPYPEIEPLAFAYPDGRPTLVSPSGGTTFRVLITGSNGFEAEPGTGMLHINTGSGFVAMPMNELSDNEYEAVFPAIDCQTDVAYYVSAEATDGTDGSDPAEAPDTFFGAYSAESRTLIAKLNFENSAGFTVQNVDVETGGWAIGTPFGSGAPSGDYDGSGNCYQTQGTIFNRDLDGGPTRLISPIYDLSGTVDPTVSYARWFYVDNNDEDRLTVQVSSNGGNSWVQLETTRSAGEQWVVPVFHIRDYVELTDRFRIRFNATDNPNDSETEAAIDAFILEDVDCGGCIADFNGDGEVNTLDVLSFLNAWNAGDGSADINGDGDVNTLDVLAFLNLWNEGC